VSNLESVRCKVLSVAAKNGQVHSFCNKTMLFVFLKVNRYCKGLAACSCLVITTNLSEYHHSRIKKMRIHKSNSMKPCNTYPTIYTLPLRLQIKLLLFMLLNNIIFAQNCYLIEVFSLSKWKGTKNFFFPQQIFSIHRKTNRLFAWYCSLQLTVASEKMQENIETCFFQWQ
jgi:hypothetical protein